MGGVSGWNAGGTSGSVAYDGSVACGLELDDELSMPCSDAALPPDSALPGPDGAVPKPDGSVIDDPREDGGAMTTDAGDVGPTPVGACDAAPSSCAQAAITTEPMDVSCTMSGDVISVSVRACETCGMAGRVLQFWVGTTICDTCIGGVSKGADGEHWFGAGGCMDLGLALDLSSWEAVDPCVDVYPRFDNAGDDLVTDATYQVRACRCDRATQTCVTCTEGACD